jgi:hypothetical protein
MREGDELECDEKNECDSFDPKSEAQKGWRMEYGDYA